MRVLIIEDYQPLRQSLVRGLKEEGHVVDASGDGDEGLWFTNINRYDVLILDLMLPGKSGLDILRDLRRRGDQTWVLILTACDEIHDRVQGLDAGADDYLTKPFALEELIARLRASGRRIQGHIEQLIRVGELEVDTAARTVRRSGQLVLLTALEYALLETLARNAGVVLTRTELRDRCYAFDNDSASNVIDVYIGYLRKKIDRPGETSLIRTRRGLGYVLGEET